MSGIQYVTDEKGRKVAVQIDLKLHRDLWEDIEDVLVSLTTSVSIWPQPRYPSGQVSNMDIRDEFGTYPCPSSISNQPFLFR